MGLPKAVVREDQSLEKAQESTFEALARHRWHWTLDEANPDRVPMREYAREIGRSERTIRGQAKGYADWTARAGARTLRDCIESAGMGAETALAHEAIADARGVTVQTVRENRPVEARRVREIARQRAEDRGTTIEEETKKAADWVVKSEKAERNKQAERAQRTNLRAISVEEKLTRMMRIGIEALSELRGTELDSDAQELLEDSLERLRAVLNLLDMAIAGAVEIDWDKEFSKLSEVN